MKTHVQVGEMRTKNAHAPRSAGKVCMHVRSVARTDQRVMREAIALKDAGFAVTILDIETDLTRPVEEDISGICVKHLMKPDWFIHVRFGLRRLIKSIQKFVYTTLQLIYIPADIYHAHDDNTLAACTIAALWHHKPLVFDAHEFPLSSIHGHWLNKIVTRLFALLIRRCAGVITVSSPIAQEIAQLYHISEVTLVRNIPAYQRPTKSDRLHQFLSISHDIKIALYQGYLQDNRNLDNLVRSAAFLKENIALVLMGKGVGTTPARLEAIIAEEGLSKRVRIIPPAPYAELLEWTASADVGLIIYKPDDSINIQMCLPNKFFEYLMAGLPILSSQLDAIAEVIKIYNVGQIIPSLAPADIATAINAMLADDNGLACMHHNALEAAQQEFYWEKECHRLVDLYKKLLSEKPIKISQTHNSHTD